MKSAVWFRCLVLFGLASATLPGVVQAAPAHRFFGQLQSATGAAITMRLRNGRLLRVDATQAFALKRVSEPLFLGKSTVVEGVFSANGIFRASAVKRAAPRPESWGLDR